MKGGPFTGIGTADCFTLKTSNVIREISDIHETGLLVHIPTRAGTAIPVYQDNVVFFFSFATPG